MSKNHTELTNFIWNIANKLRGPYRPPQYRRVMLPMVVLRRLDCVVEPTKEKVLKEYEKLKLQKHKNDAIESILINKFSKVQPQPILNLSPYTFKKLLDDPENIARNLSAYIKGFTHNAREVFEKFNFDQEISKLDEINRLYLIMKEFADIDLHPIRISNIEMGYVFEELVRKFNEQANEEAGDHFTPREVIRLMTHLMYTKDEDVYRPGIVRTIYDPTCGTGGMLSVSEEYIREQNPQANLILFGQEYNNESYAICCSDLLIKGEMVGNIILGDTLGDGKTGDGHPTEKFHYMLANPPFGVEWKAEKDIVQKEYEKLGFSGRFGPGLPRINDGALLFLLHMISKMHPTPANGGDGSKIAIVFNGSPLFTGDAGSGESNIRRWIIENDWLDTIIALPDQMFYNTGIYTYIWILSNRKSKQRRGKIQLIDATKHFQKMRKSLGHKRNELSNNHIDEITKLYAEFSQNAKSKVAIDGKVEELVCSKIFDNRDFGYLKITVERPLRLNFQANRERIERLQEQSAFLNLTESKKRKNSEAALAEIAEGKKLQRQIIAVLQSLDASIIYKNRDEFETILNKKLKLKLPASVKKALMQALSERDEDGDICLDNKGNPEPDSELRDTELVPLPANIPLPLPIDYSEKADNTELRKLVQKHCEDYLKREVLPHVPDAWIDHSKTKVGYEIPFNRHFYVYKPPRPLAEIEEEIKTLEAEIAELLKEI